jgi:hypothetical protein
MNTIRYQPRRNRNRAKVEQDDGELHFVEMVPTFDDARGRVREFGEIWRGDYAIENEETGERVFVSMRDETKN